MTIRPGVFINDRYEIIDKVGSGGMADVYKAKDHRLNRFVAVKILKAEFSNDTKFVEKFRAEAQSAAGLSHPNVVNVYDVGDEDGMYYIVMELVEGITLKSFIERKGKLDIKEAVGIAIQIAQGMEAAHSNHIVHRDIKPQNIIISREGKVKVTDFGIAKAVTSDTITSNAMGSVHYLSPEQARGGFSDEKSDIYSLGVTLYEMLSGRVPFIGENTVSVALCHLQEDAIPLRDLDPAIPVSLDHIVQKCMQKKPEFRYYSASALISDLKRSLTNPDGAYVQLSPMQSMVNAPTISISADDLEKIRNASPVSGETKVQPVEAIQEAEKMAASKKSEPEVDVEEEEDEDDVNPKLEKLMSIGGVIAAVLIVIIVIFIAIKLSGCLGGSSGGSGEEATEEPQATISVTEEVSKEPNVVQKVVGLKLTDVQTQLEELGLTVNVTEEESDDVEVGYIMEQDLEAGTEIEEGMTINLIVSSGVSSVKVTDVTGYTSDNAKSALTAQGFRVSVEYAYSDSVEEGKVIKTSPSANTSAAKGETVVVYVSQGKESKDVEVPSLIGKTKEEAQKALKDAGLKLDTSGGDPFVYSDKYKQGEIVSQSYTAGSKVPEGTSVSVTYSNGPTPSYSYWAYGVTVSDNPFNDEDESGSIKVVLEQDGKSKRVYSGNCYMSSFPLFIGDFEGYSDSDGTLVVYLDDVEVSRQGVSFKKVAE